MSDVALHERELLHRLGWFVRVRWLMIAGLAVAALGCAYVLRVEFPLGRTLAVGGVILFYNALFVLYHRLQRRGSVPRLTTSRIEAGLQIGVDLLALTTLIHFTGGAENPFVAFYLFHAVVGSTLLRRREAWGVGLVAFSMFLAVVGLEYAALLPHRHMAALSGGCMHRHVPYLLLTLVAFGVTLFATISVTCSIVSSLRTREQQLVVMQRALVKKSSDLAQANASLTEKQKQLVEKQKQLVQNEKQASLGQLVSGIAHEINNPIQFIHANMAVLSEALGDLLPVLDAQGAALPGLRIARLDYPFFRQQLPTLLGDMSDGAARIAAIVRDLKTFARRDEGRLDEHVDLNEAVRTSMRLLHAQLKRFRVKEDLDPDLPRVEGNLTQLEQVVVNAVQNAAQAVEGRADGEIRVRTRVESASAHVRLSIEDNGPGIAPEVRDRIFDPFFTTKQRTGGTGLGLAITYGIVEQHRGRIEVDTEVGAGTAFHFLLPLNRNGAA
jgi:signal transduction histidine kinase